jgi:hypothetical protein
LWLEIEGAVPAGSRGSHPEKDSEKIEQEESSENDAFRSNLSGSAYSLSGSRSKEAGNVATSGGQ